MIWNRIFTVAALVVPAVAVPATVPDRAPPKPDTGFSSVRVEAYVDGMMRVSMEQNKVAGATVAVVKDGAVLLAKGYGIARIKPAGQRADADTLFQIASISKTPVYIAIMQLVEAGKVKLDDPVNGHLPKALQIPDQGFKRPVLIRHLMTHSAGFEDSALGHLFVNKPERLSTISKYLTHYRVSRVREPGIQTSYSNYALTVLGAVIEQKVGKDFPTAIEERVLRPLGMTRSTYRDPVSRAVSTKLGLPAPMDVGVAANITQQLGGSTGKLNEMGPEYTTMVAPAGGLRASANDMAAYALALIDPARLERAGVLKASTLASMLVPGIALPGTQRLGFMHYSLDGGRTGFGHGGAMAFGASDLIVIPDLKMAVFVSTNGIGGFGFANDLVRRMLRDLAPLPATKAVRTAETKAMAKEMAGHWILNRRAWKRTEEAIYLFNAGFEVGATADGDILISDITGQSSRFEPIGGGVWQSADRMSTRVYAKDAEGTPTLWSGSGTGSAVRAGLFGRPDLILAVLMATLIFATMAALRGARRALARSPAAQAAAAPRFAFVAASAAWAIGLGGFLTVLAQSIPDKGAQLLFDYPGPMPIFAWTLALAVLLTAFSVLGVRSALQSRGWTAWMKAKHFGLLLLFLCASITCWQVGLVGFSDF